MKKFIVGAVVLAIGAIAFGTLGAPSTANAGVTGLVAVSPGLLASCTGVNPNDGLIEGELADLDTTATNDIDDCLGDGDGTLEASDFADVDDLDGNQVEDDGGKDLLLFIFVDDEGTVTVDAPTSLGATSGAAAAPAPPAGDYVCDADSASVEDDDCVAGADGAEDGVIVAWIISAGAGAPGVPGDTATVNVSQADDNVVVSVQINIVGNPDEITINEVKEVASVENEGCASADYTDGLDNDEDGDKIFLWATVTDSDGNELTMIPVSWDTSDSDIADIVSDSVVTLASDVTGAFAVLCGQDNTGEVDVTATFDDTADGGETETATVTKTIVGLPETVTLTASPAAIDCNGVNSATVTATVTDADGNNVVDGTAVRFDVVALGTASPIDATTTDGQASSTITPLSGNAAGVTVVVSAGDAEASIRVDCILATPTAPPASPTPTGPITPPVTGTGGYLSQNAAGGFSWIALAGLALGALALTLGGAAVRKVSR